jgi:hypothetical protein
LNHYASPRFWALYEALPSEIRDLADKNYKLLRSDPRHPSLQLKKIAGLWSVRIGLHYRALGMQSTMAFTGSGLAPMPTTTEFLPEKKLFNEN